MSVDPGGEDGRKLRLSLKIIASVQLTRRSATERRFFLDDTSPSLQTLRLPF